MVLIENIIGNRETLRITKTEALVTIHLLEPFGEGNKKRENFSKCLVTREILPFCERVKSVLEYTRTEFILKSNQSAIVHSSRDSNIQFQFLYENEIVLSDEAKNYKELECINMMLVQMLALRVLARIGAQTTSPDRFRRQILIIEEFVKHLFEQTYSKKRKK